MVKADMIDFTQGTITFKKHKNAKKGKSRTVYMTDKVKELLQRRCENTPTDYLFTSRNGETFKGNNTVQRIRRLEKRLGIKRFWTLAKKRAGIRL